MADFIADTTARIRTRNLRAEPVIAELTGVRRFMAKSALAIANGVDRFGGWMSDGTAAFAAGALFGVVRGAIYAGVAFGVMSVLGPLSVLAMPAAAVLFGGTLLHDAAKSYNQTKANDPRYHSARRADKIASFGGALPDGLATGQQRPSQTTIQRQRKAEDRAARDIVQNTDLEPQAHSNYPGGIVPGGFADRELQRRQSTAQIQGKGGI